MKAFFDRDGRKSNTIDIPETGQCPKTGLDICSNMWEKGMPCEDCNTSRRSVEYRTVQVMIPLHEQSVDTGEYARWSEWEISPKDRMAPVVPEGTYVWPKKFMDYLETLQAIIDDMVDYIKQQQGEPQS